MEATTKKQKNTKQKKRSNGEQTRRKKKCKTSPWKEKQSTIEHKPSMQASPN